MANEVLIHVKAKDDASKTMAAVGKSSKAMAVGAGTAALAVGAVLVKALSAASKAAYESQKIHQQTTAVLKSTGHAAGITGKQVDAMAGRISQLTGVDDELVQSGENILLTFTNVRNDMKHGNMIFDEATMAITDLSVALGQDMKTSAIQVGKALNDPVKGMSALRRVGVSFTKEQEKAIKTMVKHGHVAEAQKVILHELEKEFGGSAEAAGTWADKMKVAAGNLQENIGGIVNKHLEPLARWMTKKGIPAVEKFLNSWETQGAIQDTADDLAAVAKASIAAVKGLDKLGKSMNKNLIKGQGGGLSEFSDELVSLKAKALRVFDAIASAGAKLGIVPQKFADAIHRMRKKADEDLSKTEARWQEAQNQIHRRPLIAKLKADKRDLDAKISRAKHQLNDKDLTKERKAKLKADIAQALAAKRRLQAEIDRLHGKTVTININRKNQGAPFHASGGNIGGLGTQTAATGGNRGSQTWVGEQGPELVDLPFGSHVNSNADSMRKASQQGSGGGRDVHIHFHNSVVAGASDLQRMLSDMKRRGQLDVILR